MIRSLNILTFKLLLLSTALLFSSISTLYSSTDDVIELDPTKFDKMLKSDAVWLVEFYAPWCGHCQSLAPEWKKAASFLKGIVKVGAVDMDKYGSLGQPYNVKGFPTIKVFGINKNAPIDYNGGRDAKSITNFAVQQVNAMISMRMGGGSSGRSDSSGKSGSQGGPDVIELTDSNFDQVYDSQDMWLVEFFAPWCGHCKNLKPHWEQAAKELKGKVKIAAVDSTVHQRISQQFGIQGYPTIKYFPAGPKSVGSAQDYDGGRTADDIVNWALSKYVDNMPAPEIVEIVSDSLLKSTCEESQLCIISFFPQLLDCQSTCRNKFIDTIKGAAEKYKRNKWGWMWVEGATYPELEKAFDVGGFGYPAMVAVNYRKKMYSLLKGSFSETGINEYLRALSFGKGSTSPMRLAEFPKLSPRTNWDGKDGAVVKEEEIDLSELGIETHDEEDDDKSKKKKGKKKEDL